MRKPHVGGRAWFLAGVVLVSIALPALVLAQMAGGPLFFINGAPDARMSPPQVRTSVSVIDRSSGSTIEGLTAADFTVEEAASPIDDLTVAYEPVGLAAVIVIDRGGISQRGDLRIKEATALSREFLDRLASEGALTDDMVAIVGVNDDEDATLSPVENFTHNPVDKNLVGNALTVMEGETVEGGTPLYEGLDHALALLTENAIDAIRSELRDRRKFIVVFSDGVDKNFSDEAREQDIIRKAEDHAILIYTVGMAPQSGIFGGGDNLKRLSAQTDGLYTLYQQGNTEARGQVTDLFDRIVTQRYQYLLSYPTRQSKGDYQLRITVNTRGGSAEQNRTFSSILELPRLSVVVEPDAGMFTLPYSGTLGGPEPLTLTLRAATSFGDGVERAPSIVRYYANGDQIGESDVSPDFAFAWDAGSLHDSGSAPFTETFTLMADAVDPYLGRAYAADMPVKVQIGWGAKPLVPQIEEQAAQNWWLVLVLLAILFGLVVLMLMLIRTRNQLANKVVKGATGFLKDVTRPLSAAPSKRGPGKLVVQRGANAGREYDLSATVVKVGRDAQFSDIALNDEFVSNPHFSVHLEGTQFYIVDEGSTNGTQLNGMRLQPYQRIPLSPDALIELGQTRLQFRQVGLPTQHLDMRGPQRPSPPSNPYATGPVQSSTATPPNPYVTQKVRDDE